MDVVREREEKKVCDLFHKILKREIYLSCTLPKYVYELQIEIFKNITFLRKKNSILLV